jgi:F420-non-reducing hydrogenase iron-sulfur subunit
MSGEVIAFCCEHSAYAAADGAGRLKLRYPDNLRIIRMPCVGRVDVLHILKALEKGAQTVLLFGCEEGACQNLVGNILAQDRVAYAKKLVAEVGIDEGCVRISNVASNEPYKFVRLIPEVAKK